MEATIRVRVHGLKTVVATVEPDTGGIDQLKG